MPLWPNVLRAIAQQTHSPAVQLIVDSHSSDRTVDIAKAFFWHVQYTADFDHWNTRHQALRQLDDTIDIVLFMTQDALPENQYVFERLVHRFADPRVAVAFGRQHPADQATATAAHLRRFNYPAQDYQRVYEDRQQYGLKTAFCSNSLCAYRRTAVLSLTALPTRLIVGEDMYCAARLLKNGWSLAYVSTAGAYHSHNYSIPQEAQRYFDIGVFHTQQMWLLNTFGHATQEGYRYVAAEIQYLWRYAKGDILWAIVRTLAKYAGYLLGRHYKKLPLCLIKPLSMQKHFWHTNKK